MGLTNKKEEQIRKMPLMESRFYKSKSGKFIVHKTTITTIRPVAYLEKILSSEGTVEESEVQETLADDPMIVQGDTLVE